MILRESYNCCMRLSLMLFALFWGAGLVQAGEEGQGKALVDVVEAGLHDGLPMAMARASPIYFSFTDAASGVQMLVFRPSYAGRYNDWSKAYG